MEETNWEWTDINLIHVDNQNPNKMTKQEQESLRQNLLKFGWNMPIITDMAYLVADGEQKLVVAKELGWTKVPVLRKGLTDPERRLIRQSMNKLRGEHDPEMDAEEFKRLLSEIQMEDVSKLTGISEQEIIGIMNRVANETQPKPHEVDQLYAQEVTCPKCGYAFKKAQ